MSNCVDVINRFKALSLVPHSQRVKMLLTRQRWADSHFDFLKALDWDAVLPAAYNLYRAQQCVSLWGSRSSAMVAVALVMAAITSLTGRPFERATAWTIELSQYYNLTHYVPGERYAEMKRFLIAWSTSIPDAGLPFPQLPVPSRVDVGDGFSGWNGDRRRAIPEADLAACAATVIANNWEAIYRARLWTRAQVIPYDEELASARRLFAAHAPKSNKVRRRPKGSVTPARVKREPGDTPSRPLTPAQSEPSTPGSSSASAIRPSPTPSMSYPPPETSSTSAPPTPASALSYPAPDPALWPLPPRIEQTIKSTSSSLTLADDAWTSPIKSAESPAVVRTSEPTIEDMIAMREDTSDEESDRDSDDGEIVPRSGSRLGLSGVDFNASGSVAHGFSVNPRGHFAVEKARPGAEAVPQLIGPKIPISALLSPPDAEETYKQEGTSSKLSFKISASAKRGVQSMPSRRATKSPSVESASTLHSIGSAPPSQPMSRSNTDELRSAPTSLPFGNSLSAEPVHPRSEIVSQHIGQLIREREEYIVFRRSNERAAGRLVSESLEQFMLQWVEEQKRIGSIPVIITVQYLQHIGIDTTSASLRHFDLGPWIERNKYRWSLTECLLRAGVKPSEFPLHFLPYSLGSLNIDLYHYKDSRLQPRPGPLAERDLQDELDFIFEVGGERAEHHILSPSEVEARTNLYDRDGAFEGEFDVEGSPKRRRKSKKNASDDVAAEKRSTSSKNKRVDWLERLARFMEQDGMDEDEMIRTGLVDGDVEAIVSATVKSSRRSKRGRDEDEALDGGEDGAEDFERMFEDDDAEDDGELDKDGEGGTNGGPGPSKRRKLSKSASTRTTRTPTPLVDVRELKEDDEDDEDEDEEGYGNHATESSVGEGEEDVWSPDMTDPEVTRRHAAWQAEEARKKTAASEDRKRRKGMSHEEKRADDARRKEENRAEKAKEKARVRGLSKEEKQKEKEWERERTYWADQAKGKKARVVKKANASMTSSPPLRVSTAVTAQDLDLEMDDGTYDQDDDDEDEDEDGEDGDDDARRRFLAMAGYAGRSA